MQAPTAEVKLNTAAILREDALYKKKQEEEARLILKYEQDLRDDTEFSEWKARMLAADEADLQAEIDRRRKEMAASAAAAIKAREDKVKGCGQRRARGIVSVRCSGKREEVPGGIRSGRGGGMGMCRGPRNGMGTSRVPSWALTCLFCSQVEENLEVARKQKEIRARIEARKKKELEALIEMNRMKRAAVQDERIKVKQAQERVEQENKLKAERIRQVGALGRGPGRRVRLICCGLRSAGRGRECPQTGGRGGTRAAEEGRHHPPAPCPGEGPQGKGARLHRVTSLPAHRQGTDQSLGPLKGQIGTVSLSALWFQSLASEIFDRIEMRRGAGEMQEMIATAQQRPIAPR